MDFFEVIGGVPAYLESLLFGLDIEGFKKLVSNDVFFGAHNDGSDGGGDACWGDSDVFAREDIVSEDIETQCDKVVAFILERHGVAGFSVWVLMRCARCDLYGLEFKKTISFFYFFDFFFDVNLF